MLAFGAVSAIPFGCTESKNAKLNPLPAPEAWQVERQLDYLAYACGEPLNPKSMVHVALHLTCEQRLPGHTVAAGAVPDDAWDAIFAKIYNLQDTSDFDMTRIVSLLAQFRGHPALSAVLWQKLEDAALDFKYWYTDPTPTRLVNGEQVVDNMWYWSENHYMVFRAAEYLVGQMFPDKTFSVTGLKGREHVARARPEMLRWFDERARFGFSEWHSDVYYNWDMQPLINLVDFANDAELAQLSAMTLDLLWLDVATHLHRGNMGATHGRSYIKDKAAAKTQDIFDGAKLFFDDTTLPYTGPASGNAAVFARTTRYALPAVIRAIARDDAVLEQRERMNLAIDETPPASADAPIAAAPYDLDFNDDAHLPFWWSMNAMTTWPLIAKTYETAERLNLWEAQFSPLKMVRDLLGDYRNEASFRERVFPIYQEFWPVITEPLLKEVHTYVYRTPHYMLSAAQDYRAGLRSNQTHIWQATLDEQAVVFTTQPGSLPPTDGTPHDWYKDEAGGGYWTGQGSLPRVAAHQNMAIIIYAPQYAPKPLGLNDFDYRDETHAYFPVAHFDEVTQAAGWTLGRRGESYVGLYSAQPTFWRMNTPEVYQNANLPFDLVANGSRNVWIVELGDADSNGSFTEFAAALTAASIAITNLNGSGEETFVAGASVAYQSPSLGLVQFDWTGPLSVAGKPIALEHENRMQNDYVVVPFAATTYDIRREDQYLTLEFEPLRREFSSLGE